MHLSWALTPTERILSLSLSLWLFFILWQSEQERTSARSICTCPDRMNLTSSQSWSLSGLDGGHSVAVKSNTPWSTVTPCSSGLWVCASEKSLNVFPALCSYTCAHSSVDFDKTEDTSCDCVLCDSGVFVCVFLCSCVSVDVWWSPLDSPGDCDTEREPDNKLKLRPGEGKVWILSVKADFNNNILSRRHSIRLMMFSASYQT